MRRQAGIASTPDVVRDRFRPHEVQQRDEPRANRPALTPAEAVDAEAAEVPIGAREPENEDDRGGAEENELHHADLALPVVSGLRLFRSHAPARYPFDEAVVRGIRDHGDQVDRDRQREREKHHTRRPLQRIERHAYGGVSPGGQSLIFVTTSTS
jgi:hypothetical protein